MKVRSQPGSMHIWLELPARWDGRELMGIAEQHGVLLRSSELFAVDEQRTPNAVRLSLSAPGTIDDVKRGLETVRAILGSRVGQSTVPRLLHEPSGPLLP
jgi:DNA-binding transcriptional MocR family regulator